MESVSYPYTSASVTPEPQRPPARRKVRFAEVVYVCTSPSPLEQINTIEWGNVWYLQEELEAQRNEARELCRQMRFVSDTTDSANPTEPATPSLARDPLTRGLEQRSCLERQRRKYLALKFIVRAASKLRNDSSKLAALSARCTAWAADLAREEAARDFFRAYQTPNHAQKKRPSLDDDSARRVRIRLAEIHV